MSTFTTARAVSFRTELRSASDFHSCQPWKVSHMNVTKLNPTDICRDDKVQRLLFLIVQSSLRIKNNNDSPGLRSKHASLS